MTDTPSSTGEPLSQLTFDNRLVKQLPADPLRDNYPRQVPNAIYSFVNPQRAPAPQLVAYAKTLRLCWTLRRRTVPPSGSCKCLPATSCCRVWNLTPPATGGTSLVSGLDSWGMVGRLI